MIAPKGIASGLYQVHAVEGLAILGPTHFGVPAHLVDKYNERRRIYTIALTYIVLQHFDSDPRGHATAHEFTRLVSPTNSQSDMAKFDAAMKDLHEGPLKRRENPALSWVMGWFKQIGFEISDPIAVMMFYTAWLDALIATHDGVKKLLS